MLLEPIYDFGVISIIKMSMNALLCFRSFIIGRVKT